MRDKPKDSTFSIRIPASIAEDLKSRKLIMSEVIRNALLLTKEEPKYLYEVSCVKEDSLYYCIVDRCSDVAVRNEMTKIDYFLTGFKVHGNGAFKIRLVGCFIDMSDAMLFYEYLINKALDKGCYIVNEYGFTRYVSISGISFKRLSAVIPTNVDLSSLLSEVILILEESNEILFDAKLDESIARISKVLRKRIRVK